MFSRYRKSFYYALVVAVFVVVFGSGFYFGKKSSPSIDEVALLNKTAPAGIETDFEAFWKTWTVLNEKFVSKKKIPTDQEKVWGAISGLTKSFDDPYTVFFPPVESKAFAEDIKGEFGGVGMEIGLRDEVLTVVSPLKGSPAEKAGIRAGDRIFKIDDKITTDMAVDAAVKLIRGEKGTAVKLSIVRNGDSKPIEISITRDTINIPTIDTKLRDDGVFVISLYSFSENSPNLFAKALREFIVSGSDKLVLDLRGNPGGYLEAAVDMASWFLPAGKIIVREDLGKNQEEEVYRSRGYDIFNDKLKMVILINRGSASASEILTGALLEHGKAVVVGERSFGKGSVQELVKITPETSLKVTIARWLTPNGLSISEGGITPTFVATTSEKDLIAGKDVQMEKAVEILLKKS
ncbi:MAG: S41 family peptidase [Candidatus Paceibacterota bacterium]|jgi:carboxyl-terminal processing protease